MRPKSHLTEYKIGMELGVKRSVGWQGDCDWGRKEDESGGEQRKVLEFLISIV